MPQGISKNPLTDISKVYLEQVSAVEIDERLGGKGYKRRKDYAGRTVEGDWPDSDRGGGHKAKKRAGGKVEKKSPTYLAHVHNKKKKQEVNEEIEGGVSVETYTNGIQFTEIETVDIIEPTRLAPSPKAAEYFDWRVELDK